MLRIVFATLVGLSAAACTSTEQRTAGGALAGAGTGAVIGGLTGGSRGALVGTAVGGATGAVVGAATAPRECWERDRYGRPVQVRC